MHQEKSTNSNIAPTLMRRLVCMVYEALLLFGVIFISVLAFDVVTQSKQTVTWRYVRELWIFSVAGLYFVFFWVRSGQTLAMKTWRIRLEDSQHRKIPLIKAIVRYCLAWMWFLPGLAIAAQLQLSPLNSLLAVSICFLLWALTAIFNDDKQFLHDKLAKTRLVHVEIKPPLQN